MKQFDARILANRQVSESFKELVLDWGAEPPEPGQFLTLRVSPRFDPLLRRPFAFSAYSPERGAASVVYQVRGSATALLSELSPGSLIDAIGPLGRPFPAPMEGERAILAGGGIGLGPILFLAKELERRANAGAGHEPLVLLGFRSASFVPELELPASAILCTDDGSAGFRGTPYSRLASDPSLAAPVRLYGCGPAAMLAALAALARARGWEASLSAEQWMACGVGACMGCALERADGKGFLRACADGPVFGRDEIDWAAEAARAAPPPRAAAKGAFLGGDGPAEARPGPAAGEAAGRKERP